MYFPFLIFSTPFLWWKSKDQNQNHKTVLLCYPQIKHYHASFSSLFSWGCPRCCTMWTQDRKLQVLKHSLRTKAEETSLDLAHRDKTHWRDVLGMAVLPVPLTLSHKHTCMWQHNAALLYPHLEAAVFNAAIQGVATPQKKAKKSTTELRLGQTLVMTIKHSTCPLPTRFLC